MSSTDREGAVSPAELMLGRTLAGLQDSAAFCLSETCPLVLPCLRVAELGELPLPISRRDARRLIKQAVQAPYGRGEETLVDTDVRRVWQLEPGQFQLDNPQWATLLRNILQRVKSGFGIERKVSASLYKLLVYEKGGFFLPHRDTEKSRRMFATLTICLPSEHVGGELIVSHGGRSRAVDFSGPTSKYDLQWAAFYADCQHEVRPVTDGCRVCLIYNLATIGSQEQPVAPDFGEAVDLATEAVEVMLDEEEGRDMIVIPLLHQYSEAGLAPDADDDLDDGDLDDGDLDGGDLDDDDLDGGDLDDWGGGGRDDAPGEVKPQPADDVGETPLAGDVMAPDTQPLELKGGDRARVEVLRQVADRTDCSLYIAFMTRHQWGYPDAGSVGYDERKLDEAEFEAVFDETTTLTNWHNSAGVRQPFVGISINASHVLGGNDLSFEQSVQEATGNEGASMDRWYQHAVCVLWPVSSRFSVLASQGPHNSVPVLKQLAASARARDSGAGDECRRFAEKIISHWPARCEYVSRKSLATDLASSLVDIGDRRLAQAFFKDVLPQSYPLAPDSLVVLAETAGWKSIQSPLCSLFRDSKPSDFSVNLAGLMATFAALASGGDRLTPSRKRVCKALLTEVTELLMRWTKRSPRKRYSWSEPLQDFDGAVEPLVRAVCAIGTTKDLNWLMSEVAEKPKHYPLHSVVIPTTLALLGDSAFAESGKLASSAAEQLRAYCVAQLKALTRKTPEPPKDWRRRAKLSCQCEDCSELAAFMRDKDAKEHRFPRRKQLRKHLHVQIETHQLDCTHVTLPFGRPLTLVCTKTQASFERDRSQYLSNLELLAKLEDG